MAKLTPMKAIRRKCLDCSNGHIREVACCQVKDCPLYAYRSGHRPKEEDFTNVLKGTEVQNNDGV